MKGVWANEIHLQEIKDAGFDTEINYNFRYKSDADKAKNLEQGVSIISSLHSYFREDNIQGAINLVTRWKNNSAIGGWLLLDEPQSQHISIDKQKEFYNSIKNADPDHPLYIVFIADNMKSEYYSPDAFDIAMVDYYPVRPEYDWRELLQKRLDAWISSTRNRDIIPALQGHYLPKAGLASPVGTIQEQYNFWKERELTNRGYTIYQWETTGGDGICENPDVLKEVTDFNKGDSSPTPEKITIETVICESCGSELEVSISSIATKNIEQYCPVCQTSSLKGIGIKLIKRKEKKMGCLPILIGIGAIIFIVIIQLIK